MIPAAPLPAAPPEPPAGLPERAVFALRPTPPFALSHTLARLRAFRASPAPRQLWANGLRQALALPGGAALATVQGVGTVEAPELRVTLQRAAPLGEGERRAAEYRLRAWLGLDDDLAPFYALAERDPAFAPLRERLHGYHLLRHPTPFEAACWALVQQRTPDTFAQRTMRRLLELFGDAVEGAGGTGEGGDGDPGDHVDNGADDGGSDGGAFRAFPPAAPLAHGAREALLAATNNTRKVERLEPLARAFAGASEDFLRTAPWAEVEGWLRGIHGLGQWSADYVMLRGLGRTERTPWTDTGLLPAISEVYTGGLAIARGSARELAEGYGWYQGYWAHYLKSAVYGVRGY